jgi:hypothetical protein
MRIAPIPPEPLRSVPGLDTAQRFYQVLRAPAPLAGMPFPQRPSWKTIGRRRLPVHRMSDRQRRSVQSNAGSRPSRGQVQGSACFEAVAEVGASTSVRCFAQTAICCSRCPTCGMPGAVVPSVTRLVRMLPQIMRGESVNDIGLGYGSKWHLLRYLGWPVCPRWDRGHRRESSMRWTRSLDDGIGDPVLRVPSRSASYACLASGDTRPRDRSRGPQRVSTRATSVLSFLRLDCPETARF